MLPNVFRWLASALAVLLVGIAVWLWNPQPTNPSSGELRKMARDSNGKNYDVEIIRDNWGVPHIYGDRNTDVAFGVAYANAEDDLETMQATIAATRGVLARYQGRDAAKIDYLVALLGVWDTVDKRYHADVPDDVKAYARGYAAGLNLFASRYPDKIWPGLAPFNEQDVIAGFVFKAPFFYGFDGTLLELFGNEREAQVALDPSAGRTAWQLVPKGAPERGSNAIAVAPARSGDRVTRLLINSHQPMEGPVAWWEAHLVSGEGLNITGGLFAGTPIVLHGFNQHLGWANTVSEQDLVDVYRLQRNPDNDLQYRLDGEWRDFEITEAEISVKLWGPFTFKTKRRILRSEHGPVVEAEHATYAVRYAGMGEIRQFEQYYRLNHARNYQEFIASMSMNALPSINYVYADKEGHIALVHNGQYPARDDAWDWSADMPGDRSELIWQGYRPFSDVPILADPVSGLIYNSNNAIFHSTDGPDNFQPEDFPKSMGLQTNYTSRAMRMQELLKNSPVIDRNKLLEIKFDTAYAQNSKAAKVVKAVLALDWSSDPKLAEAAEHLAGWNFQMNQENRHAALGGITVLPKVTAKYTGVPAPKPEQAFRDAVDYLHRHYGRIDPPWGELNRLVRGDVDLPIDGGADTLRAIYPVELGDDGKLKAGAGDTWIALVEWDEAGQVSADVIHQFGSAFADKKSKHYNDQATLFANKQWRKALRDRAAIEAAAECVYRPTQSDSSSCTGSAAK